MNTNNMIQVIKDYVRNITNCAAYVGNEIPNHLYRTILNDFGNPNANPLAFIDAGMRGGMNEGVLFTDMGIDFRYLGDVGHVAYTDIRSIEPIGNNRIMICTAYGNYQMDLPFDIGLIVGAIEEILGRTIYTGHKTMPPRPEDHPDMHGRPGIHGDMHGEPRPEMHGGPRPEMQNDMPGNHRPGMQNDMPGNHRPEMQNDMPGNHRPGQQGQMSGHGMNQQQGNPDVRPSGHNGHASMPSGRPDMGSHSSSGMDRPGKGNNAGGPGMGRPGASSNSGGSGRGGNAGGPEMGRPGMGGPGGRGGR